MGSTLLFQVQLPAPAPATASRKAVKAACSSHQPIHLYQQFNSHRVLALSHLSAPAFALFLTTPTNCLSPLIITGAPDMAAAVCGAEGRPPAVLQARQQDDGARAA